ARSVANELKKLKDSQGGRLRGLIVDLRGNPGGLLKQSVKVADLLLTHGHIVSTRGRHPDSLHHYEAGGRDLADGLPTAVLVDGKSASASEIAAALQDRDRAVLVGTSSYGKGTVQTVIRLPNDGEVTLTWSRLVAPSGYTLHGLGVRPVVCTSGASPTAPDFVRKAVAGGPQARDVFASWRTAGYDDKAGRASLRETCKPERRTGDGEVRVARQLLADQALYAQALDITAGASQAQK
ncbi:MAG: S41 family peptidase, partial [Rhodospirillaceae bacterium]